MTLADSSAAADGAVVSDDAASRLLPTHEGAELAIISGVLANNEALIDIEDLVQGEHFSVPLLGRLYDTCARLFANQRLANAATLADSFADDDELEAYGGLPFLQELQESWVQLSDLRDYARVVRDAHMRRRLAELSEHSMRTALRPEPEETAEQQLERLEERLFQLSDTGELHGRLELLSSGVTRAVKWIEDVRNKEPSAVPVSSGLRDLERILGGFYRSDLLILASRPGMGKTALATTIALNVAESRIGDNGGTVAFFSLEMSHEQLARRLLATLSSVEALAMRTGQVDNRQFQNIHDASRRLEPLRLYVDDSGESTIGSIRSRSRRLKRKVGSLDLIVVDYLQLLQPGGRRENRVQEVAEITRGLKVLAKDLDVPVLALSQLSRAVEGRENKRPALSDLRDSGTIEQDADIVMFLYREHYYLTKAPVESRRDNESDSSYERRVARHEERLEETLNLAELTVAKHRHGGEGVVRLHFDGISTRFGNYDGVEEPPPPDEDDIY
ncbi:MAG: replicative DNA helicase [Alphaproteobacteria bacterium]|nr:replicative DNA helicase [Alphaproteobacteria bacterium]MDA7983093.1 replicative DNA helicase [Alphaproteobacteria bacterium]MDA8010194.1 replicative DNA helicase [Alphaproteobacteria bacterium]